MQGGAYLQTEGGGRTEKNYGSEVAKTMPARPYGKVKVDSFGMCRR